MPQCTSCTQSSPFSTGFLPASCTSTLGQTNTDNVVYTGPVLSCSNILPNDTLTAILQKIDPLLCAAGGDYSQYNTACLAPIANVQQFVESISAFVCNTQTQLTNFTSVTFVNYQAAVTNSLFSINNPGITCTSANVLNTDTLQILLQKYCNKFASIDALLNIATANWNLCYSVSPLPATPVDGFNTLIAQICLLKSQVTAIVGSGTLPVFNNTGSCLPTPGSADSLVDTVNKIKTRLCQTGTIDNTLITWGCVAQPSGAQDLQTTLQNIIAVVSTNSRNIPTQWSADFAVTNVDNSNLCLGKHIALSTPSSQDRLVAATASDTTPGTLQDKLLPGTNMALDYITTPGKVILNATAASGGAGLTLADVTDPNPDYLINKINGGLSSLGVSVAAVLDTTDPSNHEVSIQVNVDPVALFTNLLNAVSIDAGLKQLFCSVVASCPSPCSAPMNVQVTYTPGPTSSTTSTSTTTTTTA